MMLTATSATSAPYLLAALLIAVFALSYKKWLPKLIAIFKQPPKADLSKPPKAGELSVIYERAARMAIVGKSFISGGLTMWGVYMVAKNFIGDNVSAWVAIAASFAVAYLMYRLTDAGYTTMLKDVIFDLFGVFFKKRPTLTNDAQKRAFVVATVFSIVGFFIRFGVTFAVTGVDVIAFFSMREQLADIIMPLPMKPDTYTPNTSATTAAEKAGSKAVSELEASKRDYIKAQKAALKVNHAAWYSPKPNERKWSQAQIKVAEARINADAARIYDAQIAQQRTMNASTLTDAASAVTELQRSQIKIETAKRDRILAMRHGGVNLIMSLYIICVGFPIAVILFFALTHYGKSGGWTDVTGDGKVDFDDAKKSMDTPISGGAKPNNMSVAHGGAMPQVPQTATPPHIATPPQVPQQQSATSGAFTLPSFVKPQQQSKMNEQPWFDMYRELGKRTANIRNEGRNPNTDYLAGKRIAEILQGFTSGEHGDKIKSTIAAFENAVAEAEASGRL